MWSVQTDMWGVYGRSAPAEGEREGGREREREGEREGGRERERGREREGERERELKGLGRMGRESLELFSPRNKLLC